MKTRFGLSVLAGVLLAGGAAAEQGVVTTMERNVRQQERIEQGVQSGTLNEREAERLQREQARIHRAESRALQDGTVSEAEQARIKAMQDRASRNIYQEKHDAQTGNSEIRAVQRNVNQQERIQQGLQSGELNTHEAARLQSEQARVERMQANAGRDGRITDEEKARIERAQNKLSNDIYREKHDAGKGNPNSASSQRMQGAVQRNINQQQRIKDGIQSGELTNREVSKLERGQARANQRQANRGADGHMSAEDHQRVQHAQDRQSKKIYKQKHDEQQRP